MGDYKIVNAKHDRSYQKKLFNDKSLDRQIYLLFHVKKKMGLIFLTTLTH